MYSSTNWVNKAWMNRLLQTYSQSSLIFIHADGNTANDKRQWRPLPFAGGNGMTATTAMSFWQKLRFLTKNGLKMTFWAFWWIKILSRWNRSPTQIEVNSIRSRQYNLLKSKNKRSISTWIFGFYGLLFLCCKVIFLLGDNWFSFSYPKLNKSIKNI